MGCNYKFINIFIMPPKNIQIIQPDILVEKIQKSPQLEEGVHQSSISDIKLRQNIFQTVIFDRLLDLFEYDLYDAGAEEEDVTYFRNKTKNKSQEEILGILSLPKDIRASLFKRAFESTGSGNIAIDQILSTALSGHKDHGFTLGYHVSQKEIKPTKEGWYIHGKEFDDRDEMNMAYYSVDYDHFYRKKPAKYIYFVRAETGGTTAHKTDNDNRWSRAPLLSIVGQVPLQEVDELVGQIFKETKEKRRLDEDQTTLG